MVHQEQISLHTKGHADMHDITGNVAAIIVNSGVRTGTAHIFNVGSTAAIGTIEFEPGLQQDLPQLLDKLIPPSRSYGHELAWHDGNGHSHLQATMVGPSLTVPIFRGQAGAWDVAANIPSGMRCSRASAYSGDYGFRRVAARRKCFRHASAPVYLIMCTSPAALLGGKAATTPEKTVIQGTLPIVMASHQLSLRSQDFKTI